MKRTFNAWYTGAPFYGPLCAGGLLMLVFGWGTWIAWVGAVVLLLGIYALFFFRDPRRRVRASADEAVAPADGKVMAVDELEESPYYDGPCVRLIIFLSLFNVHVNRAPCAGVVEDVRYQPGLFLNALRAESSELNESNTLWMNTAHGVVAVRQISGMVARRIVCYAQPGDELAQAERFGMIRFGSRTELYLPPRAIMQVSAGDNVRAGASIVARFS